MTQLQRAVVWSVCLACGCSLALRLVLPVPMEAILGYMLGSAATALSIFVSFRGVLRSSNSRENSEQTAIVTSTDKVKRIDLEHEMIRERVSTKPTSQDAE